MEKESTLREIRKLIDVLKNWGNVLVPPTTKDKEVTAKERLHFLVQDLKQQGMSLEDIEKGIALLD
jgi:hypothetical protein